MNHKQLISFIFSGLLAITCVWVNAEELTGVPVAPGGSESVQTTASSSVAAIIAESRQVEDVIKHEIQSNMPAPMPFKNFESDDDFNEFVLIPIVSVLVVFGGGFFFIIYLVILRNRANAQRRSHNQDQIQRFIDAGRDVPDELLRDLDGYASHANLAKGIKELLVGLAITVFLTVLVGFEIGAAGLIIVAAGLARIIIWTLTQPKKAQTQNSQPKNF